MCFFARRCRFEVFRVQVDGRGDDDRVHAAGGEECVARRVFLHVLDSGRFLRPGYPVFEHIGQRNQACVRDFFDQQARVMGSAATASYQSYCDR